MRRVERLERRVERLERRRRPPPVVPVQGIFVLSVLNKRAVGSTPPGHVVYVPAPMGAGWAGLGIKGIEGIFYLRFRVFFRTA